MRTTTLKLALLPVVLFTLVGLLAACGDDDDDAGDAQSTTTATATSESAGSATVTTEDGTGTTTATSEGGGSATTGAAAPADFETITSGTLTVCTDAPYEPFEFEDPDTGEFTGFDMELLRAMTTNWDLELDVTVVPFDGIWLLPTAGECDMVASAMTITDERAENALFSDPYFDADQSLLVRAEDEATYPTLADLAGATIGVQTGTTGEAYATENAPEDAEVVSFDEAAALFTALESGDVDAILQDFPVNAYRSTRDDLFVVTERFPTGEQYGFAASLENTALIDAVNAQLTQFREDGTYDEIFAEWFGES